MSFQPAFWPHQPQHLLCLRKEWRSLTNAEQSSYIEAELCLLALPTQAMQVFPNTTTRYDDLTAAHQNLTDIIHNVAQFHPWHRYFLLAHEILLQNECNYTGPMPWWDERVDAGAFINSSLLTPEAFGGNGQGDDNCLQDGPFANMTLTIGPGTADTNTVHCLSRAISDSGMFSSAETSAANVAACNALTTYYEMWECIFPTGPHGSGHFGIGGTMADMYASPVDPLFYLHHSCIDRHWWEWQNEDPATRTYQMGGYTTQTEPATGWVNTTLDYVLTTWGIIPDVTINDVMDTEGGYLCYTYDY
ncbi:hypothetical protein BP6252_11985 [Coleophoma cylindrospora]|uniref:Tyrosinase copper-binding domain-containing protein n=1 Tax=Coleophoma cylindrospora TaxID=1849047 RepID=A0A3D8QFJ7_9HELO|nr:hypothetical protein BP6252_11985 [Coleophoma cylindrospora]